MNHIKQLCILLAVSLGILIGGFTIWIGMRYASRQRAVAAAQAVIQDFGGELQSIPAEPIGSEYFISFRNRKFTSAELDRFKAIDRITHRDWVGIKFENCELTTEDLNKLTRLLPSADLILLTDKDGKVTAEAKPRTSVP